MTTGMRFIFTRRGAVLAIIAVVLRVLGGAGMLTTLADFCWRTGIRRRRSVECELDSFGSRWWLRRCPALETRTGWGLGAGSDYTCSNNRQSCILQDWCARHIMMVTHPPLKNCWARSKKERHWNHIEGYRWWAKKEHRCWGSKGHRRWQCCEMFQHSHSHQPSWAP